MANERATIIPGEHAIAARLGHPRVKQRMQVADHGPPDLGEPRRCDERMIVAWMRQRSATADRK